MPPRNQPASKAGAAFVHCVGNPAFNPDEYIRDEPRQRKARELLEKEDDFDHATVVSFGLPERDDYTYHAMTAVKLAQVQHVVGLGAANNLHAWYRSREDGAVLDAPPPADIEAYISVSLPSTLTASALKGLVSNAKKGSLRAAVGAHLTATRYLHPGLPALWAVGRCKTPPSANPYLDFWAWSCRNLQWCGPCDASAAARMSHHVLPVLMHHFGCAAPSHEALELLRLAAAGRPIADVGSGNGYWTYMLRRYGSGSGGGGADVRPVDSMQSRWRVTWVDDTEVADGVRWLKRHAGGRDMLLLLVYPVVGGGPDTGPEGAFTRDLVAAYEGDTLAVVGTQNRNGYTGFRDVTMDEWMLREHPDWTRVVQVPLPSFAGKDEALFIFQRGERAPKMPGA